MPHLTAVAKLRLSPGEIEKLLREEKERRRKLRIIQVREKAKQVSKARLDAVRQEKVKQLEKLAERIEEEWMAEKQIRLRQLEDDYNISIKQIGTAHEHADNFDAGLEQKAAALVEYNRRADERHAAAMAKLNEEKMIKEEEAKRSIQTRQIVMAKEKLRAQEIANLPTPVNTDVQKLLNQAKNAYVQLTDAETYTYPYQLPAERCLVEKNDLSINDGVINVDDENNKIEVYKADCQTNLNERLEKARVRGIHALRRERMRQDYNNMMNELDILEKADRKLRQQNLEHIPQSLFLPAHAVAEKEAERQTQMERKIEGLFCDSHDFVDLRVNAPPLNYDTTPTVTESENSTTPLSHDSRAPVSKVLETEDAGMTVMSSDFSDTETASKKKRKKVLKNILKRIDDQKEQWAQEAEYAADDKEEITPMDQPLVNPPSEDEHGKQEESTNESLTQVPDTTTTGSDSNGQISQALISSEGETTTSSQFIERQRSELYEYIKSLESQISKLEALKTEKSLLEREESLAKKLEDKLNALKRDEVGYDLPEGKVQIINQPSRKVETEPGAADLSVIRRPDESVWDWYLRQKEKLKENIKVKLGQISSSDRRYELANPSSSDQSTDTEIVSSATSISNYTPILHKPETEEQWARSAAHRTDQPSSKASLVSEAGNRNYFAMPEFVQSPKDKQNYEEPFISMTDTSEILEDALNPVGYVSIQERESLLRGQKPETTVKDAENEFYDYGRALDRPPDFVSIEERERLIRSQLDTPSNLISKLDRPPKKDEVMQRDLAEHQMRLERLQNMISDVRDSYQKTKDQANADLYLSNYPTKESLTTYNAPIRESSISNIKPTSSEYYPDGTLPKDSYMPPAEREKLLGNISSLYNGEQAKGSRPTWSQVLSGTGNKPLPTGSRSIYEPNQEWLKASSFSGLISSKDLQLDDARTQPQKPSDDSSIWSSMQQQMLSKQRGFNLRQEELRKQLLEIQEQKRKLLSLSGNRALLESHTDPQSLSGFGVDLHQDELSEQSTPSAERKYNPPITMLHRLDDLDFHELSAIPELDTPTHITDIDESILLSLNQNMNSNNLSRSLSRSLSSKSKKSSEYEEADGHTPTVNQAVRSSIIPSSSSGSPSSDQKEVKPSSPIPAVDNSRIEVLNKLLEQLELRRAQRLNFLEQEKLTSLVDDQSLEIDSRRHEIDSSRQETGSRRQEMDSSRSPKLMDLYSSDSAEDFVIPKQLLDSSSSRSTPSGDSLMKQMHDINSEWMKQPISVPSSSQSTTPSADLPVLANGEAKRSSSSGSDDSVRLRQINQLLQTSTEASSPSASNELTQTSDKSSEYIPPAQAASFTDITQWSGSSPVVSLLESDQTAATVSQAEQSSDDNPLVVESDSVMKSVVMDEESTLSSVDDTDMAHTTTDKRPSSSTPQKPADHEADEVCTRQGGELEIVGIMDEPEITFVSTIPDDTLRDFELDSPQRPNTKQIIAKRVERCMEEVKAGVKQNITSKTIDSAARKKKEKEMAERTKRLYEQLEEVKEKHAYKAREERRTDTQIRRKEYASKLQQRAKKS